VQILVALVAAVLFAVGGPVSVAADPAEVPLDLAFRARQLSVWEDPAISPDGRFVVSVESTPQGLVEGPMTTPAGTPLLTLGNTLVINDLQTGERRGLTGGDESASRPIWSPDGSVLAYLSDRGGRFRLWVFDTTTNSARPVSDRLVAATGYGPDTLAWRPDGTAIATIFAPAGTEPGPGAPAPNPTQLSEPLTLTTAADPDAPDDGVDSVTVTVQPAELGLVDVATGAVSVVVPHVPGASIASPVFSSSGRFLAADADIRFDATGLTADLVVVDLESGTMEAVVDGAPLPESPAAVDRRARWQPGSDRLVVKVGDGLTAFTPTADGSWAGSPLAPMPSGTTAGSFGFVQDGATLVTLASPADALPERPSDDVRVVAVPLADGPAIELDATGSVSRRLVFVDGSTLWQPSADRIATVADAGAGDEGRSRIVAVSLDQASPETLHEAEGAFAGFSTSFVGPANHAFVIGSFESYARPADLFVFAADGAAMRRVTETEPRWDDIDFGSVETFETEVVGFDGNPTTVRTAVLLPPGAQRGDRLPAVVEVYGGVELSRAARSFGGGTVGSMPAPIFTSRGYAVLLVDAPMSPEGESGQPARELAAVVAPQVARAAELGYVDADRIAVAGQSYGGYSAALLLATTDIFAAGVAVSGVYDLAGLYGDRDPDGTGFNPFWAENGQGRMGVPLWEDYDRYLDNSPYALAPNIDDPLLIVHGELDSACPVAEAEKMYTALEQLGKEGELVIYPGEGHVIMEWQLENAVDATERVLDFIGAATDAG
jgi:dipeptidyl aminopeptidase/acylaminoacyl peptidase